MNLSNLHKKRVEITLAKMLKLNGQIESLHSNIKQLLADGSNIYIARNTNTLREAIEFTRKYNRTTLTRDENANLK
jgi:ribosome-associated protein YbcJ (S4-like RNA binding protein)